MTHNMTSTSRSSGTRQTWFHHDDWQRLDNKQWGIAVIKWLRFIDNQPTTNKDIMTGVTGISREDVDTESSNDDIKNGYAKLCTVVRKLVNSGIAQRVHKGHRRYTYKFRTDAEQEWLNRGFATSDSYKQTRKRVKTIVTEIKKGVDQVKAPAPESKTEVIELIAKFIGEKGESATATQMLIWYLQNR